MIQEPSSSFSREVQYPVALFRDGEGHILIVDDIAVDAGGGYLDRVGTRSGRGLSEAGAAVDEDGGAGEQE